ncbi:hypothetical protein [Chitinibacter sp. S2-10]|uniref:hypothetical protein n=1 Tax=Chitinibacter sp. S2-10 TaxID=3373597 RepID=UPI0039773901
MIEVLIQRTLPPLGGSVTPPFHDARSARDWLKLLPMINVPVAHDEILKSITQLNQSDLDSLDTLKIIEQFRESVHTLQEGMLAKLMGKPLPLSTEELQHWQLAHALWRQMESCYGRLWHAASKNYPGVAEFLPLLAERTLYYACSNIIHLAHIYRKPLDKQWRQLFAYYELACEQHIEKLKARDSLIEISGVSTAEQQFLHALLFSAANIHQYTLKQQLWLNKRLEIFAARSTLSKEAATLPNRAAQYIDLKAPSAPLRRQNARADSELEIDTLALAHIISKRIKLLRMGEMPEKIGLGKELAPQATEEMLRDLYRVWCDTPVDRSLPRRSNQRELETALGIGNIHSWLATDHYLPPPQSEQTMSSVELMHLRMFGQTRSKSHTAEEPLAETEHWQINNETAQGLCLQREHDQHQRMQLQQFMLIADGNTRLAGLIRWLADNENMREVGIELLPGTPAAAAIRAQDAARFGQSDFTKVLLLGAVPALQVPVSLITPPGWFRQGRLLDFWDGQHMHRIRLVSVLGRGNDFERIHFVASGGL